VFLLSLTVYLLGCSKSKSTDKPPPVTDLSPKDDPVGPPLFEDVTAKAKIDQTNGHYGFSVSTFDFGVSGWGAPV
jgi:hypothetical protein